MLNERFVVSNFIDCLNSNVKNRATKPLTYKGFEVLQFNLEFEQRLSITYSDIDNKNKLLLPIVIKKCSDIGLGFRIYPYCPTPGFEEIVEFVEGAYLFLKQLTNPLGYKHNPKEFRKIDSLQAVERTKEEPPVDAVQNSSEEPSIPSAADAEYRVANKLIKRITSTIDKAIDEELPSCQIFLNHKLIKIVDKRLLNLGYHLDPSEPNEDGEMLLTITWIR